MPRLTSQATSGGGAFGLCRLYDGKLRKARRPGRAVSPPSAVRPGTPSATSGGVDTVTPMRVAELELDLETFAGPFDLLMALVLREEVSLLEVELGEVVLAYLDHLEDEGELDLESATEFLVLIAALLELKSRLMLPRGPEEVELEPEEAADELLARMLEYRRYRDAGAHLSQLFRDNWPFLYRS